MDEKILVEEIIYNHIQDIPDSIIDKLLNELESFKSKNFSKEEKNENVSNDKKDSDSTENIVDSVIGFFKSLTEDKDSKEEKKKSKGEWKWTTKTMKN